MAWELTSITSYLLIGNDDRNPKARAAALQAIFITGAGGLALLLGIIIIGLIGYGIEMLMRLAERYLIPWKGKG